MLTVADLCAGYAGIQALRDVSFTVAEGEMVALIGSNGAGKSTLLNCLSGIVPATRGRVLFEDVSLVGMPAYAVSRRGLLHVPEGRQILADLSVRENLLLGRLARGKRAGRYDLDHVFNLFPILRARQAQRAGSLSGGQQQMLAIGRALLGEPRLLLLDEPSLGLSPLITDQVFAALRALNDDGLTILLVEQNARRALNVTRRAYVLEQGVIAYHGDSAALAHDARIIAHYLGHA
jgi:branched-chain amino acid transport system ATP-binding protein